MCIRDSGTGADKSRGQAQWEKVLTKSENCWCGCGATAGPAGRLLDSGIESEGMAEALEETHECIIRSVPVSACALSWAALRMAC
eukprot:5335577-Amphidinium_carterae.2